MFTALTHIRSPETWRHRKFGLVALLAVVALAVAFGTLIPPPSTAHAKSSEPWLYIECEEDAVREGDDFRLVVRKKYKDHTAPYKKIRVFWYTDAGTADETDYEHMEAVGQASNGHQSKTGKMGRNFHTRDDIFPEIEETYTVRFNNSNNEGNDGRCEITLADDDGVGIHDLEIRSVPRELRLDDEGHETIEAYTAGDVILVTARFNHPVTTVNPATGEQTDYAGIHLNIGENRRVAHVVRGDGTDTLIFGYTVQPDDVDADGISVEEGTDNSGFYFNEATGDIGIWPVNRDDGSDGDDSDDNRMNRCFHGLEDDPGHPVAQADRDATTIRPFDPPNDEDHFIEIPAPPVWQESAVNIEPNLLGRVEGELTEEDGGRDWYSFKAEAGEDYFIELWSAMDLRGNTPEEEFTTQYVENHLIDPSILEIVDEQGVQVLGEHDLGGFIYNWARAHFTPQESATYYLAIGSGVEARADLGFYTLSVRADDYADDYKTVRDVILRPGESFTACIDSDVPPDHPGLKPWDWWEWGPGDNHAQPLRGLESLDDRDFFRFVIEEEGTYELAMVDGPHSVGIWATYFEGGHVKREADLDPAPAMIDHYEAGAYFVEIGTPWQSAGNTGLYTVSLTQIQAEEGSDDS